MIYFLTKRTDHDPIIYKSAKINVTDNLAKLQEMLKNFYVGFDTEYNYKRYFIGDVLLIQIGNKADQIVIDFTEPDAIQGWRQSVIDMWNSCITDKHLFIGHNLKADFHAMIPYGFKLPDFFDTMVGSQRINLGSGLLNNLKDVYERLLKKFMPEDKGIRKEFGRMNKYSRFLLKHIMYGAGDIADIIEIAEIEKKQLSATNQAWFTRKIEFPLVKILAEMDLKGLHLYEDKWNNLIATKKIRKFACEKEMDDQIRVLGKGILELTGGKFSNKRRKVIATQTDMFGGGQIIENINKKNTNYNSNKVIPDIITKLDLLVPTTIAKKDKYNKQGDLICARGQEKESISEEAIQAYIMQYPLTPIRSFLEKLLEYKGLQKFISSYGLKFLNEKIKKGAKYELGFKNPFTNRVHTVLKQCFTDNSRLSSGNVKEGVFNVQNLPAEKEVREAFGLTLEEIAAGFWFTTVDWSGAELTIMAAMADDQHLYELGADKWVNGVKVEGDMHSPTATKCWRAVYQYRKAKYDNVNKTPDELINIFLSDKWFEIQDSKGKKYKLTADFLIDKKNNKQLRTDFKPMIFGCVYGLMAKKGSETLNIPKDEAQVVIDVIKAEFPKVFKMVEGFARFALIHGYIPFNTRSNNRRIFTPVMDILKTIDHIEKYSDESILTYVKSKLDFRTMSDIQGQARNLPISGTQADMLKESLVEIHSHNDYKASEASLLLSVHDENGCMHKGKEFGTTMTNIMIEVANRYLELYSKNIRMSAESHTLTHWTK